MKQSPSLRLDAKCPDCHGTGFPTVPQPLQPGRKIYPAPCSKCGGKGSVTAVAN